VLVTGINSGIGKVTALQLALRGATVIGTVRTEAKGMFTNDLNKSRHMRGRIIPMILDLVCRILIS
jgi:NAD(P)-dependent dehydrogenase (short-subunit alcohol dehydrogenase family)